MTQTTPITHFTAWRPLIWALTVSLIAWAVSFLLWPSLTLWILALGAGVITSIGIGARLQRRIDIRNAWLEERENERRRRIQEELDQQPGEQDGRT